MTFIFQCLMIVLFFLGLATVAGLIGVLILIVLRWKDDS